MTYKACVRARLVRHELTNSLGIRGQLEADGKTYSYETRSTIKDAVNRIYKAVNWTPAKNDEIILDGDFIQGHVIIDHIERWEPAAYQPLAAHKTLVDTLGKVLPEIPEFNRLIRHHAYNDNGETIRIARWQTPASGRIGRHFVPTIISAILMDGELRFRAQSQQGARSVPLHAIKMQPLLEAAIDPKKANARHTDRAFIPREASHTTASRRKLRAGDPNKWVPGRPYDPFGMPSPVTANDALPPAARAISDCPF